MTEEVEQCCQVQVLESLCSQMFLCSNQSESNEWIPIGLDKSVFDSFACISCAGAGKNLKDAFMDVHVQVLNWLVCSPDLSSQHMCRILKRKMQQ